MGYADPQVGIGYGYVTNRMGASLHGDPGDVALCSAIPDGAKEVSRANLARRPA